MHTIFYRHFEFPSFVIHNVGMADTASSVHGRMLIAAYAGIFTTINQFMAKRDRRGSILPLHGLCGITSRLHVHGQ